MEINKQNNRIAYIKIDINAEYNKNESNSRLI